MADDESTNSAEQELDTSVSDDSSNDDVDLEDIEVDLEDISAESEPTELLEVEDEATDEAEEKTEEPVEEESTDDTEEPEAELSEEEKQKAFRKEMYERRQAEKAERLRSIKESQQEYLAEAQDDQDLALRQLQIDAYDNKVTRNQDSLTTSYERALKDFDVLQTSDPVIQAEIDAAIDAFQAQYVTIDRYGNPTDVRGDLYATLQAKADSIEKLTGIRAKRQEQSKTKEKSKVLATPNRAPREPKKDPMLEAFDEEAWK